MDWGQEMWLNLWQGKKLGPPKVGEVSAELPKGSSVCRAPKGTRTSKAVGKHPPLPHKGQGSPLSLPQSTVPRVSPEKSLTYSPGAQGSCKRKPLPPRSPFLQGAQPPPKKSAASVGKTVHFSQHVCSPTRSAFAGVEVRGWWEKTASPPA